MVSYSTNSPVKHGISIAYCNLFDENKTGKYGPYLNSSDTAKQYNEGQIDPRGPGWEKNLREQFARRKNAGFEYIELDNPDAYTIKDVIGAIELAETYGLKVIAKNPGLMGGSAAAAYVVASQRLWHHRREGRRRRDRHGSAAQARPASRTCRSGSSPSAPAAVGPTASPARRRAIATWA